MSVNKYNPINDVYVANYLDRLIPKIFKLLPISENSQETFPVYHENLMLEITSFSDIFAEQYADRDLLSLICNLESLCKIDNHDKFKRKVFECISITKKLR